jgi:hypothetical protein
MNTDRNGMTGDRRDEEREELDRRLIHALETRPSVRISEDFALRVASKVPAESAAQGLAPPSRSVGRRVAWAAAAVLMVAILAIAPSVGIRTNQWVEIGLAIEFAGLTAWLTLRPTLQL